MQSLKLWLGVELDEVSAKEKLISMFGGFLAILAICLISSQALHLTGSVMLVASMGASAVLLFAVPHGQLSQPWPVLAGHVLSALAGVTCAQFIAPLPVAAACAVGIAIGVMHQCKCIHPPGGATALTAVIGGPSVKALGYSFVLQPVMLDALAIVTIAILFNWLFPWRRYPAFWNRSHGLVAKQTAISHAAVVTALRSLDSFVDVTEDDLVRLCDILVQQQSESPTPSAES